MAANDSGITSFTLTVGTTQLVYSALTAGGALARFGLPPQSSNYRGVMTVQAVGVGAAPTTVTGTLEISLDQAATPTWGTFNKVVNVTAAPSTQSAYSGFNLLLPTAMDVSGCGGLGTLRLNLTTFTLGSASAVNVYIHIG